MITCQILHGRFGEGSPEDSGARQRAGTLHSQKEKRGRPRGWFEGLILLFCLVLASGCGQGQRKAEEPGSRGQPQEFAVRGVVREIKPDGKTALIAHEEIPGYMAAMTMPFRVKETNELAKVTVGDQVRFRLVVTSDDGWIEDLSTTGRTNVDLPPARELFRQVRNVEPLNIGDPLPNYHFTNELGQAIALHDFRGKALAFTFIFTRCPFPTFCPRMNTHFADAHRQLAAIQELAGKWQFLTISFDPEFDTSAVLKKYAEIHRYEGPNWSFLTGALMEIDALTEQFGLYFSREGPKGLTFNHNLRTVVVGPEGKVQRVLSGNEWTVDELVAEMKRAAQGANVSQ